MIAPSFRLDAVRRVIADSELDALVVTSDENRRYLSGFSGSAGWVVLGANGQAMDAVLTDFRYLEQAAAETRLRVIRCGRYPEQDLLELLTPKMRVGLEADHLTHAIFSRIAHRLTEAGHEPVPTTDIVAAVRMTKDERELAVMVSAASIASRALHQVPSLFVAGMTERRLASELRSIIERLGGERESFEIIVASGPRSALPHGRAGDCVPQPGDLIVIDLGAVIDGYCSDITRTFVVGEPDGRQLELHSHVRRAQELAIAAMTDGTRAAAADAAARDYLESAGHGDCFGHSLGHGVGLSVHEGPRLMRGSEDVLTPGMVCTAEPGVYIPGWGGIRIEDMVVVHTTGPEVITDCPRSLVPIG